MPCAPAFNYPRMQWFVGAQILASCCICHKTFLSLQASRCSLFQAAQFMFYSIFVFAQVLVILKGVALKDPVNVVLITNV